MLKWRGEFLVFFLLSFLSDICGSIRSIASSRNWQKSRIPDFLSALAGSFQQTGSRRSQCSRREIVNSGDVAGSQTFKGSEVWPPVVKQGRWCSLRSATESLSQALKLSLQLLLENTANNDKFKFYLNADCNTPRTILHYHDLTTIIIIIIVVPLGFRTLFTPECFPFSKTADWSCFALKSIDKLIGEL